MVQNEKSDNKHTDNTILDTLISKAKKAQALYATFTQSQVDINAYNGVC